MTFRARVSSGRSALALLTLAHAAITGGCGGMGAAGTSTPSGAVGGQVTVENRSQLDICSLMMMSGDSTIEQSVELHAGQSVQVDIAGDTNRMYLTECGGARTLYGHPMNWLGTPQGRTELLQGLRHDRIVLYAPGEAPSDASDHRAVELNPRPVADWIFFTPYSDASLAESLQAALVAKATQESWTETFAFSLPLSDWNVLRNRHTGIVTGRSVQAAGFARWPDGHCTMQAFGYEQSYDGSDFSGALRVGTSTQLEIPCAALDYAAGVAGGGSGTTASRGNASGSTATAGNGACSNTCSSSNDGECDDGGPRSQYSVCALGSDCADCGAR